MHTKQSNKGVFVKNRKDFCSNLAVKNENKPSWRAIKTNLFEKLWILLDKSELASIFNTTQNIKFSIKDFSNKGD